MTEEEKRLLVIELCARVPYGVICTDNRHGDSRVFNVDTEDERVYYTDFDEWGLIKNCKLYLRPMSSMSRGEKREMMRNFSPTGIELLSLPVIDWLNAHHFDYRGLITMGLAIEAPEDMYKKSKV